MRSAKLHQNLRAGVETRPYNGAPSRRPLRSHYIFIFQSERSRPFPTVVGAIHESPACHSEPTGEESRFAQVYFALLEILRFAQDDKLGFVYPTVGAGFHARPSILM